MGVRRTIHSGMRPALSGAPAVFRRRNPFPIPCAVKPRPDPTNLDHVAYTIVALGIVGWILALLIR